MNQSRRNRISIGITLLLVSLFLYAPDGHAGVGDLPGKAVQDGKEILMAPLKLKEIQLNWGEMKQMLHRDSRSWGKTAYEDGRSLLTAPLKIGGNRSLVSSFSEIVSLRSQCLDGVIASGA